MVLVDMIIIGYMGKSLFIFVLPGCDENCQVCDGLNQCRVCEQPYAVLRGQCVRECGKQHFMDPSLQKCTRKHSH